MGIKRCFEVIAYKLKGVFSNKISASATIYGSKIAKSAALKQNTRFYESSIDNYSFVGRNCLIQNTEIGKYVSISDNCNLGLPSHPAEYVSTSPVFLNGKNAVKINLATLKYNDCKKLCIGNDVWIGSNALIKAGLKIGNGAIIGAGAVVTHDIPPYEIWAGVPARFIRKRFDDETVKKLLEIKWWEWDDKKIKTFGDFFNDPQQLLEELQK